MDTAEDSEAVHHTEHIIHQAEHDNSEFTREVRSVRPLTSEFKYVMEEKGNPGDMSRLSSRLGMMVRLLSITS